MDRSVFRKQAENLVAQMTVEEAASQLLHESPTIERLQIPAYVWWNEGLHGVARAGTATVFPQSIAMAATFDMELLEKEADMIAREARAKYNAAQQEGDIDLYKGLTLWSPNINIFRDPRWGRGHETYGEDPFLTGEMGNAYISGLQGDGTYLKAAACVKHLAVHSGPEALRHSFDAQVSEKDLRETYLPAFETAVKDADVEAVMGAYNRVNGEPACGSRRLLADILRGEWGFDGHVVSDCFAVKDFHEGHGYTARPAESASLAVRMGCDLNCGCTYEHLLTGLQEGLITEEEIRTSAVRVLTTRLALGMFDPECEYNQIPYTDVGHPDHRKAALEAAEKSMVLLKNNGILPLQKENLSCIAVIGPNAASQTVLHANYHGDSDAYVTNLAGIRAEAGDEVRVLYSKGCDLTHFADDPLCKPNRLDSEAMAAARAADVVILCLGLDETLEGEQGDAGNSFASGDKEDLLLPEVQHRLTEKILELGKPTVIVINSGSALDLSAYEEKASAIMHAWYPGQSGGTALANILFGKTSPSGKLPLTFYYNAQPMPDFTDYGMAGRTYKFINAAPWYPFGHGLSYTAFAYRNLSARVADHSLAIELNIANTGSMDGAEVTQCYLRYEGEAFEKPRYKLLAFKRTDFSVGESKRIAIEIPLKAMESILEDGTCAMLGGRYTLFVGGSQPDTRSIALGNPKPLAVCLTVSGGTVTAGEQTEYEPISYPDTNCYAAKIGSAKRFSMNSLYSELCANPETKAILMEVLPQFFSKENPFAEQMQKLNVSMKDLVTALHDKVLPQQVRELEDRLLSLS